LKTIISANVQPWTKVGEPEELTKSFGAYLMKQAFRSPEGKEDDFSLFGGKNWATICPITKDGNLVLVRQYKQGINDIVLEFPAGTAEAAEDLEKTAARELTEETGYRAGQIISLDYRYYISTRKSPNYFRVFVALRCSFTDHQKLDADENIEVLEATPEEFWFMVRMGEIVDPSTLTAALQAVFLGQLLLV